MFSNLIRFTQEKTQYLYENSLFLQNIDKLIFASVIAVFLSSTVMSSDVIGFIALITVFLTIVKILTKPHEKLDCKNFELWLLAYFMIVIISLAGSTLFHLSLKGFFKTFTYLAFYFSMVQYLKSNRNKLPYVLAAIGICVSFEAVAGFLQNFAHVDEISTWQDVSKLNPEEVMTRVYGTLKPYNPNLLGGYFVAGIPSLYALAAYYFAGKKLKFSLTALAFALLSTITLFLTGCRGSYIGMMVILISMFAVSAKYLWNNYKQIYLTAVGSVIAFGTAAVLFVSSLRARVLSIFAMRQDSSNSFRFNVYHSSVEMFKDNWLLGIGVGNQNFREIYGLYMKTGFDALSAYNIFLEIAVESGIFALIAFMGFLITLIKNSINFILKSTDTKAVIIASAAIISIIAVCIHGLVDTVFFRPQIQFIFWTMVAVARTVIFTTDNRL
ncbi:MAG TPA: O-antigen ligase family protein [Candidatus Stercorousia faecigallinarum]|nr:O-antigen ligase family protein [Candidatus Stercorousia faecigallinarum]